MQNKKSFVLSIILTALAVVSFGMLFAPYFSGVHAFYGFNLIPYMFEEVIVAALVLVDILNILAVILLMITSVYTLLRVLNVVKFEKLDKAAHIIRKVAMIVAIVTVAILVAYFAYAFELEVLGFWGALVALVCAIGIIVVNTMLGKSLENKAEVKEEPAKEEVAE